MLVSHGGLLHYITEDWEESEKYVGTGWYNCETRSYAWEAGVDSDDDGAHILETQESRLRRGKSALGASRVEVSGKFTFSEYTNIACRTSVGSCSRRDNSGSWLFRS